MRELTVGQSLTAATSNTVYTVPKGCKAIITTMWISNSTNSTKHTSASWYDNSDNTSITLIGSKNISSNDYLLFNSGRIVLDEYDELRITPETGATMSAILTMEIYQNTAYQNGS